MPSCNLIADTLLAPHTVEGFSSLDWDLLIRQGRRANLLARLAQVLREQGKLETVPEAPRHHLQSALRIAERQTIAVRWEVANLHMALAAMDVPLILLKGAAYLMAGLPASKGRVFSDVDIIVPKALIGQAESALMIHGWRGAAMDAYDQRYYREWMHEIPPMTHVRRGTTVDVHHSILPETARVKVNAQALFEQLVEVPGHPGVQVLPPVDMLLHSAAHLFQEGELDNGLRDLFDLDSLLRHFGAQPGFWDALVPRAGVLGLTRPLHYAVRYTTRLLGTPVPKEVLAQVEQAAPAAWVGWCMDRCYERGLRPAHPSCDDRFSALARMALYVRSHWIRLPLQLLTYHLGRKALLRMRRTDHEDPALTPNAGP
jgi:hypothetical protein